MVSCFCLSGVSCNSFVKSLTICPLVGCPVVICFPQTRSPQRRFHTPPSSTPSRNTTKTRIAASPRFLSLSMICVRHHHQYLIAIRGWTSRIREKFAALEGYLRWCSIVSHGIGGY